MTDNTASAPPTHRRLGRRHLLLSAAAASVSACSVPPTVSNMVNVAAILARGVPDAPFTPEYVENLPYASLTAKIGRGQRSLLILSEYDGPDLRWLSANEVALVTRNGRLVKTAGLDKNLSGTYGLEDDPISAQTFDFQGTYFREIDLRSSNRFGVPIRSTFQVEGRQTIQILDKTHDTLIVRERCQAESFRWVFNNTYWLDFQTGFNWRSLQYFEPSFPQVELQVTKPALPAAT